MSQTREVKEMKSTFGARRLAGIAVLGALGCTGTIGSDPTHRQGGSPDPSGSSGATSGGGSTTGGGAACASASARRIRRLSQREYFNVVGHLLRPDVAVQGANMLPLEPTVAGV